MPMGTLPARYTKYDGEEEIEYDLYFDAPGEIVLLAAIAGTAIASTDITTRQSQHFLHMFHLKFSFQFRAYETQLSAA